MQKMSDDTAAIGETIETSPPTPPLSRTSTKEECPPFLERPLPHNYDSLCWFNAVNSALFHKQRPELYDFFSSGSLPELKAIYDYYSCEINQTTTIYNIIKKIYDNFRTNTNMQNIFNDDNFKINTTETQGASDYIQKIITNTGNTILLNNNIPDDICLIDLMIEKNNENDKKKDTIIVEIGLSQEIEDRKEMKILETFTLSNGTQYELDSFIIHRPQIAEKQIAHYLSVLKLEDKWYMYNDLEIKNNETLEDFYERTEFDDEFETILKTIEDIRNKYNNEPSKIYELNPYMSLKIRTIIDDIIVPRINSENKEETLHSIQEKIEEEIEKTKDKPPYKPIPFTDFQELMKTAISTSELEPNKHTQILIYSKVIE